MAEPLDFVIRVKDDGSATVERFTRNTQKAGQAVSSFAPTFTKAFSPVTSGFSSLASGAASAGSRVVGAFRNVTGAAGRVAGSIFNVRNAIGGIVVGSGLLQVAQTFGQFEQQLNRVRALTGATGADFAKLESEAKRLGETTQFSASQVADAQGFLAQAGFETNQILGSLEGTLNLAAAAQLDLASSADIVSNVLSGLQLPVSELGRANDTLVKTFTSTNTNLSQLGEAFKFVGPVISSAGVDFEEASAAIGLLGNAGIQGSLAGTSLRGAITKLLNPTAEAAKTLKDLGVQATNSTGDLLPLNQIIEQLEKSGADTSDIFTIFGQRAGPSVAALIGQGSGALRELTGELKNAGGTAQNVASVQMEGLTGAITQAKSAIEGTVIALGDALAPLLITIATNVADAARSFTSFITQVQETRILEDIFARATIGAIAIKEELLVFGKTAVDAFLSVRRVGLDFFAGVAESAAGFFRLFATELNTFFLEPTRDTLKQLSSGFFAFSITINRQFGLVFDTIILSLRDVADKVGEFAQTVGNKIANIPGFGALGEELRNAGISFRVAGRILVKELGDVEARETALVEANRKVSDSLDDLVPTAEGLASGFQSYADGLAAAAQDGGLLAGVSETLGAAISSTNQELLTAVQQFRALRAEREADARRRAEEAAAGPQAPEAIPPPRARTPVDVGGLEGLPEPQLPTGEPVQTPGGLTDFLALGPGAQLAEQTEQFRAAFAERSQILVDFQTQEQEVERLRTAIANSEGAKREKFQKELDKATLTREKTKRKLLTQGTSALFGALASISQSGGERIFQVQKAFAVADATINAFRAANVALGSAPPPLNVILAAAALAQGLATVRQIKSTSPGGGGGGAAGGFTAAAPTTPTPATPAIPEETLADLPEAAPAASQRGVQVIIQGNVLGEEDYVRTRLAPLMAEAFGDEVDFGVRVDVGRT